MIGPSPRVLLNLVNFFDFAVRRRTGSVNLYSKILKKTAAAEKTSHRELARKACHGLEEVAKDNDFDLMEVHWGLGTANHAAEVFFHTIFQTPDA